METFCSISIGWFHQAINLLFLKNVRTLDIVSKVGHLFDVCYCCFYLWSFCFLCMQELVENMYIRLFLFFYPVVRRRIFFLQSRVFKLHFLGFFNPLWIHVLEKMRDWDIGAKLPIWWLVKILGTLCYRTILLHTNQKMYYYYLYTWAG